MSIRKTDRDIRREETADAVNRKLAGAGIYNIRVAAGGRRGPYCVTVEWLNEREMRELVGRLAMEIRPDAD
jgi:hypothetical protein